MSKPTKETKAEYLLYLREHLGLTQTEMGSVLKTSPQTISNLERGAREVSPQMYELLLCIEQVFFHDLPEEDKPHFVSFGIWFILSEKMGYIREHSAKSERGAKRIERKIAEEALEFGLPVWRRQQGKQITVRIGGNLEVIQW